MGWYYWGPAFTSFFREVCKLELDGDLWQRAHAHEAVAESACWWYPHKRFVMVCEHPTEIHRELVDPARPRGWGSHRLHNDTGPAVAWPDGWGVYSIHGARVPRQVVEAPHTLTPAQITSEPNAEVRRIMVERYGADRLMLNANAQVVHEDDFGRLLRLEQPDDEPVVMVAVVNSTAEPDGTFKDYMLRVDPRCRPLRADGTYGRAQPLTAVNAVASTFGMTGAQYLKALVAQT